MKNDDTKKAFTSNDENVLESDDTEKNALENKYIAKSIKGDTEAFGHLIKLYESFVYNLAYQMVGNPEDAFDISQDVFMKAFRFIKGFRNDSKFSTWLYTICSNTSKDYLRAKTRRHSISLTDYDDTSNEDSKSINILDTDPTSKPDEVFEMNERRDVVRLAIKSLSSDHRTIIVLRDIEGYSYEDIADILDIEIGTVKSRINRARNAVKEFLINRNIIN